MTAPRSQTQDLPPPVVVEDERAFESMLKDLEGQSIIAFDTEADSFFSYQEKVCLVQVTVEDRDYVVDPLADFDLTPLGEVLADPKRRIVFHDGEYDILILKRDYGFDFAGLFDTRVAAAAIGESSPGLASVLKKYFEVELDKTLQRSNWSQRPLDPKQISYARLDTRYLIPLAAKFEEELDRMDRTEIVEGEFRRLEQLETVDRKFNADEFVRMKGVRDLSNLERQALRELYILRDKLASELNRPPFKVLSNQVLFNVACALPTNSRALIDVPMFSSRMVRKMGEGVIDAITKAVHKGPIEQLPQLPPKDGSMSLDEAQYELHERLRSWRKRCAETQDLDSSLVMNRHVLMRLAVARPRNIEELEAVEGFLEWQSKRFGQELLQLTAEFEQDVTAGRLPTAKSKRGRGNGR
jgi:ribonuclease D